MTKKLLIVNADDFGIHQDVNYGIIQAHQEGLVRSTSLMVNMAATDHAVVLATSCPNLGVGLHLNISSQFSLSPNDDVRLLVDTEGRFLFDGRDIPGSLKWLRDTIAENPIVIDQIAIEFDAQVERFRETGLSLEHVNIHHYLALLHPSLFQIYVSTAEKAGVPYRGLCFPIIDILRTPAVEIRTMDQLKKHATVPAPDYSISNLLDATNTRMSPSEYQQNMLNKLAELAQREDVSTVEIVTHPANITTVVRQLDSYLWARELEMALVTNKLMKSSVASLGYEIGGYSALCNNSKS